MLGLDRPVRGHVLEHLHHVVGADVERVGGEGGVEEVAGLGLAADLHVEHPQADPGVGAFGVGGRGEQERALGRVVLAAVGQPFAERGVERRGPRVIGQRRGLGERGPGGIDQQPRRGGQAGQGVLVAGVLGDRLARGGQGVEEPLVGDVQVGQQDLGRGVTRVDLQRPLGLRPPGGELVALQVGLARGHDDLGRARVDLQGARELLHRRGLVVAREEEPPLQPGGLPAMRVGPQRPLVDHVDDVVERLAQLVPPGLGSVVPLGGLPRRSAAHRRPWRTPPGARCTDRRTTSRPRRPARAPPGPRTAGPGPTAPPGGRRPPSAPPERPPRPPPSPLAPAGGRPVSPRGRGARAARRRPCASPRWPCRARPGWPGSRPSPARSTPGRRGRARPAPWRSPRKPLAPRRTARSARAAAPRRARWVPPPQAREDRPESR